MSTYLLDTTVLIAHLRGDRDVGHRLRTAVGAAHQLAVDCVQLAEVESGLHPGERARPAALFRSLGPRTRSSPAPQGLMVRCW